MEKNLNTFIASMKHPVKSRMFLFKAAQRVFCGRSGPRIQSGQMYGFRSL